MRRRKTEEATYVPPRITTTRVNILAHGTGIGEMEEAKRDLHPTRFEIASTSCAWCERERIARHGWLVRLLYRLLVHTGRAWWIEEHRGERILWMESQGGICEWHREVTMRPLREKSEKVTRLSQIP